MRIGVPKEIKIHEYRVGLVPAAVRELTAAGHSVLIQSGAGAGIGCGDDDYRSAGATVAPDAAAVFEDALSGVAAGHAGNFGYVVGVDRVGQAEELRRSGADVVVTDLAELLQS